MENKFRIWKRDAERAWKYRGINIKIISRKLSIMIVILLVILTLTISILLITEKIDNKKISSLQEENIQWCKNYNQMANLTEIMIRNYINSSFSYSTPYSNCDELEEFYGIK
jgi:hypothetical protein